MGNTDLKIIELRAENFKRLHAVSIKPDGSLYAVGGRNGQGKSSVLDAVWAALGGSGAIPEKPIHAGQEKASVFVDLGELRITRTWSSDDNTTLKVEARDGAQYKKPQAVLDCLVGKLTFDPLAFGRMKPAEQATTLRELVGLNIADLNTARDEAYSARTYANADVKRFKTQVESIVISPAPESIPAEIPAARFVDMQRDASAKKASNDAARRQLDVYRNQAYMGANTCSNLNLEVQSAERKLEGLRNQLAYAEQDREKMLASYNDQIAIVAGLVDPDMKAIDAELAAAELHNRDVRIKQDALAVRERQIDEKLQLSNAQVAAQTKSNQLTARLEEIDAEKSKRLAAATFPIPGLSIANDVVTFSNLPLSQASSAEQLRVSLAIGAALNPRLRVMLVRDGSLLDADSMAVVAEWAQTANMQVLIERVGDIGGGVGVIIEDGMVQLS